METMLTTWKLQQTLLQTLNMSISLSLNGKKFSEKVSGVLNKAVEDVLVNTQDKIVTGFRKFPKPPIKSSQLRDSINFKMTGIGQGKVFAQKDYAGFVEFGTYKMEPRPYMRNGVADAEKENVELLTDALNSIDV